MAATTYAQQLTSVLPVPDGAREAWLNTLSALLEIIDQQLNSIEHSEAAEIGYLDRKHEQHFNQVSQALGQIQQNLEQLRQDLTQTRQDLMQIDQQQVALKREVNRLGWLVLVRAERKLRRIFKRDN